MQTTTKNQTQVEEKVQKELIFYAYANQILKTWFISPRVFNPIPQDFHLLYHLVCQRTKLPISTTTTFPKVGDIVWTTDNQIVQILNIE